MKIFCTRHCTKSPHIILSRCLHLCLFFPHTGWNGWGLSVTIPCLHRVTMSGYALFKVQKWPGYFATEQRTPNRRLLTPPQTARPVPSSASDKKPCVSCELTCGQRIDWRWRQASAAASTLRSCTLFRSCSFFLHRCFTQIFFHSHYVKKCIQANCTRYRRDVSVLVRFISVNQRARLSAITGQRWLATTTEDFFSTRSSFLKTRSLSLPSNVARNYFASKTHHVSLSIPSKAETARGKFWVSHSCACIWIVI